MVFIRSWWAILLVIVVVASTVRSAQEKVESVVSLDVARLLETTLIFPGEVRGGLWILKASAGRRLVALPLRVKTGGVLTELKLPSVNLRGGRFLCWQISNDDETKPATAGQRSDDESLRADSRRIFGAAGSDHRPPGPTAAGGGAGGDPANPITGALPEDAPRLARKLIFTPEGQVTWKLDRSIPGTEPASPNSLYALKARPNLLREGQPEKPARSTSTAGSARERAAKRREADAKYRTELRDFRRLKTQVQALPETFSESAPEYVWAVFDVPLEMDSLSFGGPAPMPWRIEMSDVTQLAEIASRSGGGGGAGLDAKSYSAVLSMAQMIRHGHPLTHRLVASALSRSRLTGHAQRGDQLDRMIRQLLASPDTEARRTTITALANVLPPTWVTATLLRDAAASMTSDLQLISLRGLMNGDTTDPQQVSVILTTIRPILLDPQGPDAGDVLEQVATELEDKPEAVAGFAGGIDFAELPPQRLDQAIRYIVSAAPSQPMAGAWLDRGLLGAFDNQVAKRTLEMLIDADRGPSATTAVTGTLMRHVFGSPPEDGAASRQIKLEEPILIHSARHALLNLLQSGDAEVRDMAWQALPAFEVATPDSAPAPIRGQPAVLPEDAAVIGRIMRAALDRPDTPTTLTSFFSRQTDTPHVSAALVRLVIHADTDAARSAAGALLGSGRTLDKTLSDLEPQDRWRFAVRMYRGIEGEVMSVVGLTRHPDPTVIRWLADHITSGRLPNASEWAGNFKDDTVLVRLAGASDKDLAAGAVAALVFAAGGDRFAVTDYTQRFATLSDRTEAGMTEAWKKAKQDIFARRLTSAAGTYTFILIVHPPDARRRGPITRAPLTPGGGAAGLPGVPGLPGLPGLPGAGGVRTLTLATVELIADGSSVRFRHATVALSIPTDAFAIRINNAGDLKNFTLEELATLNLQSIRKPIDLFPQPDGSWEGEASLHDGSTIDIKLEPSDTL